MTQIMWDEAEERLTLAAIEALQGFATESEKQSLAFLAIHSNYYYGKNSIALDTLSNSLSQAKAHHEWVIKGRQLTMSHPRSAEDARYHWQISSKRIVDHSPEIGFFSHPEAAHVNFPKWEDAFRSAEDNDLSVTQGHVMLLLGRVLERIAASEALRQQTLAPVCRLGFQFEDDDLGLIVSHIVNWPAD